MTRQQRPPWAVRLQTEREVRAWSKHEMARRLLRAADLHHGSIENLARQILDWEKGKHFPRDWATAYATAFAMTEGELFGSGPHHATVRPSPHHAPANVLTELLPHGDLTPDDEERLILAADQPLRIDGVVVEALSSVLASQRRLEDAIGPAVLLTPMTAQMTTLTTMLRHAPDHHRADLAAVASEWTCFLGWLHAAVRKDAQAFALFEHAQELADEAQDGTLAATAMSFRGYVARIRGRHRAAVRFSFGALGTPGSHATQRTYDMVQAAQGYAGLGATQEARRLLDQATELAATAGEPPPSVYWYSEPFFRVQIGLAQIGIGEYRNAAEMIATGLAGMPESHRNAEWANEYKNALADAKARA